MTWKERRDPSHWREFEFMLNEVRQAVDLRLPLKEVFSQWPKICERLAEAPRRRRARKFPETS